MMLQFFPQIGQRFKTEEEAEEEIEALEMLTNDLVRFIERHEAAERARLVEHARSVLDSLEGK